MVNLGILPNSSMFMGAKTNLVAIAETTLNTTKKHKGQPIIALSVSQKLTNWRYIFCLPALVTFSDSELDLLTLI